MKMYLPKGIHSHLTLFMSNGLAFNRRNEGVNGMAREGRKSLTGTGRQRRVRRLPMNAR